MEMKKECQGKVTETYCKYCCVIREACEYEYERNKKKTKEKKK